MYKSITLHFTENKPLKIVAKGVTIFVGPNSSGKSLVLKEFQDACTRNNPWSGKILETFDVYWPLPGEVEGEIEDAANTYKQEIDVPHPEMRHVNMLSYNERGENKIGAGVLVTSVISALKGQIKEDYSKYYLSLFQIYMNGKTRFEITSEKAQGDLLEDPINILARLFQDKELRERVREIFYNAFGMYFVIDALKGGVLRVRLSDARPNFDEQSLGDDAREFYKQALYIEEMSDGIRAYIGILILLYAGDYRSVLIDEPEAFLHPPLARRLGQEMTKIVEERGGSLMASTHSADFLMGCLQQSSNVRVVRLEYSNKKSSGRIVDADELREFFKTPLIRSANVISGLFHDGVVVTESDNDRVFYQEIYFRLMETGKKLPSLLFVNAQNKQTIPSIVGPLRKFGVPAVAVCDIDFLKDGGATFSNWMSAAKIPEARRSGFGQTRGDVKVLFGKVGKDMKKDGGVSALESGDQQAANDFFDDLEDYGVFVCRNGELENWLCNLNVTGKGTDWAVDMLERLGSDPAAPGYIHPGDDDVWEFMRRIVKWVSNPGRKGTDWAAATLELSGPDTVAPDHMNQGNDDIVNSDNDGVSGFGHQIVKWFRNSSR